LESNPKADVVEALQKEVQFLRERETAVFHFFYGVAVGFIIFWVTTYYERQTD
jgi:hypothetical protein